MRTISILSIAIFLVLVAFIGACGSDDQIVRPGFDPDPTCDTIAWDVLLTNDESNFSAYGLFTSPQNPTANPADTGLPYDLNTGLFTDYASKYRFVFIPCDSAATYDENEAFVFPVGTAITKTFTMPADTGVRGFANETLIETRLMINRAGGWVTLPYIWLPDGSDAVLKITGETLPMSVVHKGETKSFDYGVPSQSQCAECHIRGSALSPIGPKASNLNGDFEYEKMTENQLTYWQNTGQLQGVPADLNTIKTMPVFDDEFELTDLVTETERNRYAKAYLDVNCAHCHRLDGAIGNRKPYFEFWREIDQAVADNDHGLCQTISPGNGTASGIHVLMRNGFMPKLGTDLVHDEGLALIAYWVDNMTYVCP